MEINKDNSLNKTGNEKDLAIETSTKTETLTPTNYNTKSIGIMLEGVLKGDTHRSITLYIEELKNTGRFPKPSPENTRESDSVSYFREESWMLLEYASHLLASSPTGESLSQIVGFVSRLLGDSDEGREVAKIITTAMISDALTLRKRFNQENISEPTQKLKKVQFLIEQKNSLIELISKESRKIKGLDERSIAELQQLLMKVRFQDGLTEEE